MTTEDHGFEAAETFYQDVAAHEGDASSNDEKATLQTAITFLDHDDLFSEDARNENLVIPDLGIGAGPPVGLFGQGFVGKTIMAMSMGMAVALGNPVWGRHRVRQGTWVHFDYEQGRRETKKRVKRLALGFGATKEDLRGRLRVAIYPSVDLTTADALEHYVEAMSGAAIATIDALKGITPGVEENSSAMRDYMRTLSMASERTGCTVLLIHHAGKDPGKKARKEMGRGSSAIYDECQSVFVVTGDKNEDKRVTHEKDRELGELVPEFSLRIEDVPSGDVEEEDVSLDEFDPKAGLRVVVPGQPETEPQAERIVSYLQGVGSVFSGSKTDLVKAIGMNRSDFYRGFGELERSGRVQTIGRSKQENRPQGQILLVADENEESSRRPDQSPTDRDGFDPSPRNSPHTQSYKDCGDYGTICETSLSPELWRETFELAAQARGLLMPQVRPTPVSASKALLNPGIYKAFVEDVQIDNQTIRVRYNHDEGEEDVHVVQMPSARLLNALVTSAQDNGQHCQLVVRKDTMAYLFPLDLSLDPVALGAA